MLNAEPYGAEALVLVRVISQVSNDLHEAPNSPNSVNSASTTRKLQILNSFHWHLSSVERTQWWSSIANTSINSTKLFHDCSAVYKIQNLTHSKLSLL